MRRIVILLLVFAVAGSVVVTGCGSSKKKTSSTSASSADSSSSSGGASTTSAAGSGGAGANAGAGQAAKQACEAGFKNNPEIAADKQSALSADCQKVADAAASGDKAKFKAAYSSFCDTLASALPSQAQGPAKSACQQAANALG